MKCEDTTLIYSQVKLPAPCRTKPSQLIDKKLNLKIMKAYSELIEFAALTCGKKPEELCGMDLIEEILKVT